jgi:3-oxoacyl-[acyl-carrier protein] reductase
MDLGLAGKGALIVGAGADVGRATAITLAQEGARLVLAGRGAAALEETARLAEGGDIVIADLADADSVRRLASEAEMRLGGIDVLVNTVGPFPRDPTVTVPAYGHDESWLAVFDSLFLSAARLGREVIPLMKARGKGAVVNLSANSARHYSAGTGQYGNEGRAGAPHQELGPRLRAFRCPGECRSARLDQGRGGCRAA